MPMQMWHGGSLCALGDCWEIKWNYIDCVRESAGEITVNVACLLACL